MSTSNKPSSCITSGSGCSSGTNYPQFIDTGYCLCGLVNSRAPNRNGNLEQLWRCIGNANEDVNGTSSDHGEWYMTQYPSADLSGLNQRQNFNSNPPNTKTVYALTAANGNTKQYVSQSSIVQGQDPGCTGVNNTQSSAQYYTNSKGSSASGNSNMAAGSSSSGKSTTIMVNTVSSAVARVKSTSSSPSSASSSPSSSSSSTAAAASTTSSASATSAAATTVRPTAGNDAAAIMPSISMKSLLILGMLALPAIAGLA